MDRRKSLKIIGLGVVATGAAAVGCKTSNKETPANDAANKLAYNLDRNSEELKREKLIADKPDVFTAAEMATITVLADIIIPRDKISGSASDADVPAFIAYIAKDMPQHEVPLKGGLRWLDMQCLKKYEQPFTKCNNSQQIEMVDAIAYPDTAAPEMAQGVAFFNLMRNLTATGFYTTKIGVEDIGYKGNSPNQWNGVPDDVLKQYNMAYTEKELNECVKYS